MSDPDAKPVLCGCGKIEKKPHVHLRMLGNGEFSVNPAPVPWTTPAAPVPGTSPGDDRDPNTKEGGR